MPDASPSWRSTLIQALVVLLVLALAWLKAVSTETIAGALMMVVTAIFMGQREARTLAAVQAANNQASNPRMPALRGFLPHPPAPPGPNERVTVEMNETREPVQPHPPARGRVSRQSTPGEIRAVDPRVEGHGTGSTEYGGRDPRGPQRGGGGFDDSRRTVLDADVFFGALRNRSETLPGIMFVVFLVTCALAWGAKLAMAGLLTR